MEQRMLREFQGVNQFQMQTRGGEKNQENLWMSFMDGPSCRVRLDCFCVASVARKVITCRVGGPLSRVHQSFFYRREQGRAMRPKYCRNTEYSIGYHIQYENSKLFIYYQRRNYDTRKKWCQKYQSELSV